MGIVINENDVGLNDLAGLALTYTDGHDLPNDIYIYGLQDGRDYQVYIDPQIPGAEQLQRFIERETDIAVTVGLPTNPRRRPAIGMTRTFRSEHIEQATRVAAFTCFVINGRVRFTVPAWGMQVGDLVTNGTGIQGEIVRIENTEVTVRNPFNGNERVLAEGDVHPVYPTLVGHRVRPIQNRPTYDRGTRVLNRVGPNHVGVLTQIEANRWSFEIEDDGRVYYVDPMQLVRIA